MLSRREFAFLLASLPKDKPQGGAGKPYLKFIEVSREETGLDERCAAIARGLVNDPLLTAYSMKTPAWSQAWVQTIRALPEEHGLKQLYVQFLKETYGYQIQRVTTAYSVEVSSFTELGSMRWTDLDLRRSSVLRDDAVFLGWIAETFFGAVVSGIRREDKTHAVLSPYLDGAVPQIVREAARKHFEVLWLAPEIEAPGNKQVVRWPPG